MRSAVRGRIVGHTTRPLPSASSVPGLTSAMAANARLRRSADVRAAFAAGTVAHGRAMAVHCRVSEVGGSARWTVVAGRKVGNAVARNRAKRRLRAVLREADLPLGVDLVVVARPGVLDAGFQQLGDEFRQLLGRSAGRAVRRGASA